jgi:peptide/nickel transport system permease protein
MTPALLFKQMLANRKARAGIIIFGLFVLMALIGPWLVQDPTSFTAVPHQSPSWDNWFGTTGQGQDVFAQTVVGTRVTLAVGCATGLLVVLFGAVIGGVAGYLGGRTDNLLSLLINVFLVMPGLPLMVVLAAWLPPGPITILAVLVLTGWAWNARVLRAQTLSLAQRDFVLAAKVTGESSLRIVTAEILPNMLSLMTSSFIGATIYAVGAQVGLEFLGLGDISKITWGTNLYWASNDSALLLGSWWTFVPTGFCIALLGFGLTLINFGVDEIANPSLATESHWVRKLKGQATSDGSTPVVEGGLK